MKDTTTHKSVVFVSRAGIQFYGTDLKGIMSIGFDPKSIKDSDVLDSKILATQVDKFIQQYKIIPSLVLFVFDEGSTFYQDFKETSEAKLKLYLQEFVNNIPFETILTKVYRTKGGVRIASINERLYREVASAFESKGFVSLGVVPSFMLPGNKGLVTSLDVVMAKNILANIESVREQSFLGTETSVTEHEPSEPEETKSASSTTSSGGKSSARNIIILGVVFAVLIGIFIFILVRR